MAAFANNTSNPIANLNGKIVTGYKEYRGNTFKYTIYYNPHKLTDDTKNTIIKLFGNRIQKGDHCLGITETIVRNNINNEVYDALIHVKNNDIDDSATGTLQYRAYCKKTPSNQLWISDLCRVNNSLIGSPHISPIHVLLDVIEELSKENNINENYLMVDEDRPGVTTTFSTRGKTPNQIKKKEQNINNQKKRRNAKQSQIDKLTLVYNKYGFSEDTTCNISNMKAMKKILISNNMSLKSGGVWRRRRRTRKNKK